jgi:hypothetical protein
VKEFLFVFAGQEKKNTMIDNAPTRYLLGVPAAAAFVLLDFSLLLLFLINEWACRFWIAHYRKWANLDWYMRIKLAAGLLQPVILAGGFAVCLVGFEYISLVY